MGFRHRSSIRLGRGLRINLSKSGASLSVGGRGATLNLGRRGVRTTVGLPGSGISYSESVPWHRRVARRAGQLAANPTPVRRGAPIVGWLILIVAIVAIVAALGR
jgi:hypothetical protein